jgi:hypothetical protein
MTLKITQANKAAVLEKLKAGRIDGAAMSGESFVEKIIKKTLETGITGGLEHIIADKSAENSSIPMKPRWVLAIAAMMKVKTSMTDIPHALEDAELLAMIGWNLRDSGNNIAKGLMDEGEPRHLFGTYTKKELVDGYNNSVQQYMLPKAGAILVNDRGFLSREVMNMPETVWRKHPNRKRERQKIAFISDEDERTTRRSVTINGCVVHDAKDDEYYVFVTTDTEKTAR